MDGQLEQLFGFVVVITIILAGMAVLLVAMVNRRKLIEMRHRERIAMIERGLAPPPELDPNGFERRALGPRTASPSSVRFRSAGLLLIGMGLGLMLLISYAGGAPGPGIGVGGAFAVVGATLLINAMLSARDEVPSSADTAAGRVAPPEPPTSTVP